ncbi:MAG: ABC transporter ATP-binding protein [Pseudomonadota bacterium]
MRSVGLIYAGADAPVFGNIDLDLQPGEFTVVVGASGAGKSTLLRIVAGLLAPSMGAVDRQVADAPDRRAVAMVFQEARLMPWRTVAENVAFGLEGLAVDKAEAARRVAECLALVGLADYAGRWPSALSGGQRQRVGIARALAVRPDLLLMDEPFGALDAITRQGLQDELTRIWRETGCAILFVTHDIDEAVLLGDEVVLLGGAPARIAERYRIDTPRPRARDGAATAAFAADVRSGLSRQVEGGAGI